MVTMAIVWFITGALFGTTQFLLAKRMFDIMAAPKRSALYVGQLLILSVGLLVAMFLISETALLYSAIGLVATLIVLAVINSLKR